MQHFRLGVLVTLLAPFVFSFALGLDIYVPAIPSMVNVFQTTPAMIQLTLSLYMLVNGLGQLFLGPLADRFGRKTTAFYSALAYTAGAALCAFAGSIDALILARILCAMGACGMQVCAFAIVRDLFSGNESGRLYSYLNATISASPLLAPLLGGYLDVWFGWRSVFIFLTGFGIIALLLVVTGFTETLNVANKQAFNRDMLKGYWQIVKNKTFWTYALCNAIALSCFFVFFSTSPFLMITDLHVPETHFGIYFGLLGMTFLVGSIAAGKSLKHFNTLTITLCGVSLLLLSGVVMLIWYQLAGLTLLSYLLPCMLMGIGGAFMMGPAAGGAMQPFPEAAGRAAALLGCSMFLISALVGMLVMQFKVTSTLPLALTLITLGLFAFVICLRYKVTSALSG